MLSYTIMSALLYVVELIKSAITKTEKPEWKVSLVAIIVSVLFAIYFFVPAVV